MVSFFAAGRPAPKGSFRVVTQRRGRRLRHPQVLKDSPKTYTWERVVAAQAQQAMRGQAVLDGPLVVTLAFALPRPKSHFGKRGALLKRAPAYPAVAPDLDKVTRATLDAMEGLVFTNDSRVVDLFLSKRYAPNAESTGCRIHVDAV